MPATAQPGFRVLLIEDDPGDAFLVRELLAEADVPVEVVWVRSVADAEQALAGHIHCVLLDLGLPDAHGLGGLHRVLDVAAGTAVLVLTGLDDLHRGVEAVAAGAQDYLVKGEVDGRGLARAIRYAIERRRTEESIRALYEAEARHAENARLERGLLPLPLLRSTSPAVISRYRPGRERSLLGGDFYDAVETADGRLHVMIGDVCGHGPDEAALGVCLRIAWRTLVLAGHPVDEILPGVESVLVSERPSEEIFATACMLTVAADRASADLRLAGHPPPVRCVPTLQPLPDAATGPPLGVLPGQVWAATEVRLGPAWSLLLYTDGLIDGRVVGAGPGPHRDRLGADGLLALLAGQTQLCPPASEAADGLIAAVEVINGGPLMDDVAMIILSHPPGGPG